MRKDFDRKVMKNDHPIEFYLSLQSTLRWLLHPLLGKFLLTSKLL